MESKTIFHLAFVVGLILATFSVPTEVYGIIFRDLFTLFSGNVAKITSDTAGKIHQHITAIVIINCVIVTAIAVINRKVLGKPLGRDTLSSCNGGEGISFVDAVLWAPVAVVVLSPITVLEDLFARWFFLGLLVKIPLFSGALAFYLLALIGNSAWALVHLGNYAKESRNAFRVAPQFVSGIFFTYVFIKYGLLVTILTHLFSNMFLMVVTPPALRYASARHAEQ